MAGYLTQDTLRIIVLGVVAVAAISMGAATIDTVQSPVDDDTGEDLGGIEQNNTQGAVDNRTSPADPQGEEVETGATYDLTWCSNILSGPFGGLLYFGAFFGLLYGLKRRYSLGVAAFAMYGLSPVVLMAYFISTDCATGSSEESSGGAFRDTLSDAAETQLAQPDVSPLVLVGVLGLVLVATAAVIIRSSSNEEIDPVQPADEPTGMETDVADLAAAAGAAADRLEEHNVDVDNEVYRAWWEMTSLLDVPNPHSSTPGEFADAAIEVGMGEEYVEELTRLFEEVRYGQRDAESREQQAIDVFRAIESEYGQDSSAFEEENETDNTDGAGDSPEGNDGH